MKNKANLVLITMTIFSALLAVCLVYIYVNTKISNAHQEIEQKYATLAGEHEFCDVVVCAADISAGAVIGKDDLLVLKINRKTICDANIISEPSQVINRKAQYKMYTGEWIVLKDFIISQPSAWLWTKTRGHFASGSTRPVVLLV